MTALILSGFPGIGKSTLVKDYSDLKISDSDSSKFSKDGNWPHTYLRHIIERQQDSDLVLISSHPEVRQGLHLLNVDYHLFYPRADCKAEYMARYVKRGNVQGFLDLMNNQWDAFLQSCRDTQGAVTHHVMQPGEFLSTNADVAELLGKLQKAKQQY